jgi:hypothetical protein
LHQRRPDEDRVRSGELGGGALRTRVHAALGDDDRLVLAQPRDEIELRAAVDLERREVACVHSDHLGAERDGTVEVVRVVRLHECLDPELARVREQAGGLLVVDVAQDDEGRVGAGELQLEQVELLGEEALCE